MVTIESITVRYDVLSPIYTLEGVITGQTGGSVTVYRGKVSTLTLSIWSKAKLNHFHSQAEFKWRCSNLESDVLHRQVYGIYELLCNQVIK